MSDSRLKHLDAISANNIIAAGSRGMTWIVYSEQGRPDYIAKNETSFADPLAAELLEQTSHPCLPRCFGSTCMLTEQRRCFLFEYVSGTSLKEYQFSGYTEILKCFAALFDLLTFMQTMFTAPLLHLDIKPENIIIRDNGQPVLIDFDSACVDPGKVKSCTHNYASPEHRAGRPKSASDVYSLALTMAECFLGLSAEKILDTPLAQVAEMMPQEICFARKVLINSLSIDPEDRPQSDEAASILKQFSVDKTVEDTYAYHDYVMTDEQASVVCVWQSAEMACEFAAAISRHKGKVLLVDADWINPRSDLLLGLEKIDSSSITPVLTSYLDTALKSAEKGELDHKKIFSLARETSVPGLFLLMPSGRLEFYEKELSSAFCVVIEQARQIFDLVVILAGPLIYDDLTCASMALADQVIAAVKANTADLRALGRMMTFIHLHQLADTAKFSVAAHDYSGSQELSVTSLNELCSDRLIGTISFHQKRRKQIGSAHPYALRPSKTNRSEYDAICRKLKII